MYPRSLLEGSAWSLGCCPFGLLWIRMTGAVIDICIRNGHHPRWGEGREGQPLKKDPPIERECNSCMFESPLVYPYTKKHPKLRPWSEFPLPRNSAHRLSFSFPWSIQSLGWSDFWSEFGWNHGPSFVPRSQKHWGRGRRMSIE